MNRGLGATDARYLWVCDDDDILLPGAVDAMWGASEGGARPLLFGNYRRFRDTGGRRVEFSPGYAPDLTRGVPLRHVLEDLFVMQNATLVATDAVRAVGGFSETLPRSVDYEFFVRLFASVPAHHVNRDIFLQRQHDQIRGPVAALVPRARNDLTWLAYDRQIFSAFAGQAPLALFEEMFDGHAEFVRRAALLQRATVLARHDCWDLACADLDAAADGSSHPLSPVEIEICRRALSGKHGVGGVFRGGVLPRLGQLSRANRSGLAIVGAIVRGGMWRLRGGHWQQALMMAKIAARFGPAMLTLRGPIESTGTYGLYERSEFREQAYLRPGMIAIQ